MHERAAVRQAIVAQLTGAAPNWRTSAEGRVVKSRQAPVKRQSLPMISVASDSDITDTSSLQNAPRELKRNYQVVITGWVLAEQGIEVDDALDALALEIEAAMDVDTFLDGHASDSVLLSSVFGEKLDGDRPMGVVELTYNVVLFTDLRAAAPAAIFDTAAIQTSLGGAQAPADQPADLVVGINQGP